MTQTAVAVSLAEVQAALKNNHETTMAAVLLRRPGRVDMAAVTRFAEANPDSNLVELANRLNDALAVYNQELESRCAEARQKAKELSNAFAQEMLFGCPIPGDVTLPYDYTGRSITFRVEQLESVHENEQGLCGFVRVSSHEGMCSSSERFYTRDGRLHFAEPDLY